MIFLMLALAGEPTVLTNPRTLTQAVAAGDSEIVVTQSGVLTAPLVLKPGQTIRCEPGVTITWQFFPTPDNGIVAANGNTIDGCGLIRDPTTETGSAPIDANGPHGIYCRGCSDLTIRNVIAQGWYGDGLYLGPGPDSQGRLPSRNIVAEDSAFLFNGRQGVSIVSGDGVQLLRCTFAETTGGDPPGSAAPGAGIDIEPSHWTDWASDIVIQDCLAANNNGYGYLISLARLTEQSQPVSITGTGNVFRGDQRHNPVMCGGFQPLNSDGSPQTIPPGGVNFVVALEYGATLLEKR